MIFTSKFAGFTPDVKVWEVKFTRSGDFEKMSRAFELTGHASGVFSFDFRDTIQLKIFWSQLYWLEKLPQMWTEHVSHDHN